MQAEEHAANPQIRHITGWRRLLVLPLALTVKLWCRTLRFEVDEESRAIYADMSRNYAFLLWHNRLFIIAEIGRRLRPGRKIYGLVSASKDGAWLEAFFEMVGIHSVRGSSSKLGREAASALVDTLRSGRDLGITPDGPRGPRYEPKAGVLIVAKRSRTPLVLIGGEYTRGFRLKSWDRFFVPLPFSRVRVYARHLPLEALEKDRDAALAQIREGLIRINRD